MGIFDKLWFKAGSIVEKKAQTEEEEFKSLMTAAVEAGEKDRDLPDAKLERLLALATRRGFSIEPKPPTQDNRAEPAYPKGSNDHNLWQDLEKIAEHRQRAPLAEKCRDSIEAHEAAELAANAKGRDKERAIKELSEKFDAEIAALNEARRPLWHRMYESSAAATENADAEDELSYYFGAVRTDRPKVFTQSTPPMAEPKADDSPQLTQARADYLRATEELRYGALTSEQLAAARQAKSAASAKIHELESKRHKVARDPFGMSKPDDTERLAALRQKYNDVKQRLRVTDAADGNKKAVWAKAMDEYAAEIAKEEKEQAGKPKAPPAQQPETVFIDGR